VRPCISCNQLCWGRRSRDYWISCLVNPSAGREFIWGGDRFEPASEPGRVLVVGGGPAGLEAARVAAERGHAVTLVEATDQLGGQWRLAGLQPTRSQILDHLAWYERELARLGVEVRLVEPVDAGAVGGAGADHVIVATGAAPANAGFQRARRAVDRLPGVPGRHATAIEHVLDGSAVPAGRVALVDDVGDWRGIGTAMFLQERGCQVTLVTAAPTVAAGLFHSAADEPARQRFARAGGELAPHRVALGWADGGLDLRSTLTGAEERRPFDWLVLAETARARTALGAALAQAGVAHHAIGDCVAPRRASQAIYEGRKAALAL
jgi:hypothetical protein